jgi:hypothetical protein
VFTSPSCALAFLGDQTYGAGQHYVGTGTFASSRGYADIDLSLPGPPAGDTVVSLTATRLDHGATSEFSRCLPIAGADHVAQADVAAGQTGTVHDGNGVNVSIPASRSRAAGGEHDAGTLYVTRYATTWLLTDRGLTAAGGAEKPAVFAVCLDPSGTPGAGGILRRGPDTGGTWAALPTTRAANGYLCAAGVTALGEFGLRKGTPIATPTTTLTVNPTVSPTTTPTTTARPKATLKNLKGKAKLVRKAAQFRLTCGPQAACKGTVKLTAKLGRKTRRIGTASFTIAASKTKTVKVKLSHAALKALKHNRLKVAATAKVGTSKRMLTIKLRR